MHEKLEALKTRVAEKTNVKESAAELVTGLADHLDGLDHDPVAIKAAAVELRNEAATFGEAVCANTQPTRSAGGRTGYGK